MKPKIRGTLQRLVGGEALRDSEISGWTYDLPAVGESFLFYGPPRDPIADLRVINTSPIASIDAGGDFTTSSGSVYRFETFDAAETLH